MSKVVEILKDAFILMKQNANIEDICEKINCLDKCHVKVWREDETVKLPTYAKEGDACMDIYVHSIEDKEDWRTVYHTGLHFRLPEDYEMEIRPRSSMTKTMTVIQNSPGTLDEGYTGELLVVTRKLTNTNPNPEFKVGDRIAQILVRRRERIVWDEVNTKEELGKTDRGDGGFGSSGK